MCLRIIRSGRTAHCAHPAEVQGASVAAVQGVGKWFEGAQGQSVYWAVSNDTGLTWGQTSAVIPSPDTLPLWGPVMFSTVRLPHLWSAFTRPTRMLSALL